MSPPYRLLRLAAIAGGVIAAACDAPSTATEAAIGTASEAGAVVDGAAEAYVASTPDSSLDSGSDCSSESAAYPGLDAEFDAQAENALPEEASTIVVSPDVAYQTMDGFGASDVFTQPLTPAEGQLFFDPVDGIGLSLLRVGIDVTGYGLSSGTASDVQLAASYGARVWGSPWSPPGDDKTNDDVDDGGHLCSAAGEGLCTASSYDAWATILADFPAWLVAQTGVSPYAISAQNEPNWTAPYSSCLYTGQEMVNFIKVLAPKLAALTPPVKLLAPEPASWAALWIGSSDCTGLDDYGPCIHGDSEADSEVAIFATHDYSFAPIPAPSWLSKPVWETEVSGVSGSAQVGPSVDIDNGLAVALWIYNAVVTGGASAWHYWWLVSLPSNYDNEGLLFPVGQGPSGLGDINSPPKRLYALGNFSKFVRPGYVRVDVSGSVPAGVSIVAFQSPTDDTTVVVAINVNSFPVSLPVSVSGTTGPSQVASWVTSASANLASTGSVSVDDAVFTAMLDSQSITTFVGTP